MIKCTQEDFIAKAKQVHGNKYDYSKVEYINNHTKVCIICPIHGEFWQIPANHTHKTHPRGCPKCNGGIKYDAKEWLEHCQILHQGKYDYSKVDLDKRRKDGKICIICKEHGEFWQLPTSHYYGQGCAKCKNVVLSNTYEFIQKARLIHKDKYDYSKVEYVNTNSKVCIICKEHGEFWQTPNSHLANHGCPICGMKSQLEEEVEILLNKNNIRFIRQYREKWLGRLSVDFYLIDFMFH